MAIRRRSIKLHKQWGGKLEVRSKAPINNRRDLSVAYTPGVAAVCRAIAKTPRAAASMTIKKNSVAVITDGSAVLGLGNLGPLPALPVMEGKCILFKKLANIDAFPICLDTQDVEEVIATIKHIAPVFGAINLEDIAAPRCFEIEGRLRSALSIPVLHDDQHGTAVVALAALINALKVKGERIQACRIVVCGAGAAGTAITNLLVQYGASDVIVVDRHGILCHGDRRLNKPMAELARHTNRQKQVGKLIDALIGADVFIGVSGAAGIVTAPMVRTMNPDPIIFALSNPDPEIDPKVAKNAGALIVATGRSDYPNQLNNVLAFPGVFRGALDHQVRTITQAMLLAAAKRLAACIHRPTRTRILPGALDKRVVTAVASAIR
ncbi:NADP-dependent malic enzyme [Candidatus Uhrbacteria bacterium]|nr:NADP-dependent malic enzyme [Candidatus Uhrbacteria bacterium]